MCRFALIVQSGYLFTECDKDYIAYMNDKLHKINKLREINDFTVSIEIQPLKTGDVSLKVRQECNINVGKTSLTKRNITT